MAQIVYVIKPRNDTEFEGDVIGVYDDDAELSGPGYQNLGIKQVEGKAEDVRKALFSLMPEQKMERGWVAPDGTVFRIKKDTHYGVNIMDGLEAESVDDLVSKAKVPLTELPDNTTETVFVGTIMDQLMLNYKKQIKQYTAAIIHDGSPNITESNVLDAIEQQGFDRDFSAYLLKTYPDIAYDRGYIDEPTFQALVKFIQSKSLEELMELE